MQLKKRKDGHVSAHLLAVLIKELKEVIFFLTNLVVGLGPIPNKQGEFSIRGRIWNGYSRPLSNIESTKTTSSFMDFG